MPISYDNVYDLSRDDARIFQRATIAAVRAALDLSVSATGAQRTLCTAVLASPETYGHLFAFVLGADTQFNTAANLRSASDAVLLASVKAAWPAMAGG